MLEVHDRNDIQYVPCSPFIVITLIYRVLTVEMPCDTECTL